MGLSAYARTRALTVVFSGDLMVGLTREGREIADEGISRRPVRFESRTEATVVNATDARFGPWLVTSPLVTGWVVFDDQGRELAVGTLEEREFSEIRRGDELVLRAGNLIAGLD